LFYEASKKSQAKNTCVQHANPDEATGKAGREPNPESLAEGKTGQRENEAEKKTERSPWKSGKSRPRRVCRRQRKIKTKTRLRGTGIRKNMHALKARGRETVQD